MSDEAWTGVIFASAMSALVAIFAISRIGPDKHSHVATVSMMYFELTAFLVGLGAAQRMARLLVAGYHFRSDVEERATGNCKAASIPSGDKSPLPDASG